MLLFRSEEHIDRECAAWKLPRGATLTAEQASKLADSWYRERLSPDWRRRTVNEAHDLYRPAMVFKVFDTDPNVATKFTAHSAFDDPNTPPNAPPRESIETRTFAFWD